MVVLVFTKVLPMVLRVSTVLVALLLLGMAIYYTPSYVAGKDRAPEERHVYKKTIDGELSLFVFRPAHHDLDDNAQPPKPAIVFFHGGGWGGGKPAQMFDQCQHLADQGLITISAEYRVQNRHGTTPFESISDAISAVRWVRAHAQDLGIDPNRIGAAGTSAGAHLAAFTATFPTSAQDLDEDPDKTISPKPNALILFNPVIDNGPGGYGHDRIGSRYVDVSPLHNISTTMPPTLVMIGDQDHLVPVATAERFRDQMLDAGARSELVVYPGQPHDFFDLKKHGNPAMLNTTNQEMTRFLKSIGWIN